MVDPPGQLAEGTSADAMATAVDADVIGPPLDEWQGRDSVRSKAVFGNSLRHVRRA